LSEELGIPFEPHLPLIGLVGRLADQKGWDLVIPLMHKWVHHYPAQWVILGTGDARYHESLGYLASQAGHRLALRLEFSDRLAHRIEAASDLFLMPSRFEPCGLNQLYSLKYGTPPVVHAVGGLVDTVTHASPENLNALTATGFVFNHYSVEALEHCLHQACEVFRHQPDTWKQIVETGMQQNWSWLRSACEYESVYSQAISHRQHRT
jgi:starch synthase